MTYYRNHYPTYNSGYGILVDSLIENIKENQRTQHSNIALHQAVMNHRGETNAEMAQIDGRTKIVQGNYGNITEEICLLIEENARIKQENQEIKGFCQDMLIRIQYLEQALGLH